MPTLLTNEEPTDVRKVDKEPTIAYKVPGVCQSLAGVAYMPADSTGRLLAASFPIRYGLGSTGCNMQKQTSNGSHVEEFSLSCEMPAPASSNHAILACGSRHLALESGVARGLSSVDVSAKYILIATGSWPGKPIR